MRRSRRDPASARASPEPRPSCGSRNSNLDELEPRSKYSNVDRCKKLYTIYNHVARSSACTCTRELYTPDSLTHKKQLFRRLVLLWGYISQSEGDLTGDLHHRRAIVQPVA